MGDAVSELASWSDLEIDALKELTNIGVGRASGILSEMAAAEIKLSVPELLFADPKTLAATLNSEFEGEALGVSQSFKGPFSGMATLVFVDKASTQLIEIMLGEEGANISPELEAEALEEIGNIVLNGSLGAMADSFSTELRVDLPIVIKGDLTRVMSSEMQDDGWQLFLVRVALQSDPIGIGGLIVLTLAPGQSSNLRKLINDLLAA
ncbi:MAG: chemotaxis protein CheC [Geminicoccaceae bacterium]